MSTYQFELPTTGSISFGDFCLDSSRGAHARDISSTTQHRANLRGVLKETKRTDGEKDFLRIIKILDDYIPQLRGIMACVAHDEISLKEEPVFSWRTTLSANVFHSSPRVPLPNLHADYVFSLITYAFSIANLARTIVSSLGAYEQDRHISDPDRKSKDERLNHAVTFLCRSSGIFSYIADTSLLDWEKSREGNISGRSIPPELSREVNEALSKMTLADAQKLAIRKLLSKSAYDSNVAPGPPLPRSHPSPALLAKLHLECASLYNSARTLAKTPGASGGPAGDVTTDLRKYLSEEAIFHNAMGKKWLGVDGGENGGSEKGGEALGFITWARKDLEDMGKGLSLSKGEKNIRKERIVQEAEALLVWQNHYKKFNDTVHFQPVPSQADLQSRIPAGRMAVAAKPYVPPEPAFGPDSAEALRRRTENLVIYTEEDGHRSPEQPVGSYAGAGSYF